MIPDFSGASHLERLAQVERQLMTKKVEIDPCVCRATFFATQDVAVKAASLVKVGNMKRKVKKGLHCGFLSGDEARVASYLRSCGQSVKGVQMATISL
jgi:hypothetical protein